MQKKLKKIALDTNIFLKGFIEKQKKTSLISPMRYGLFPGGKKIRSKILIDIGSLFNINYKILIKIGAAIECIHAYSLIHDDLPCMDNDKFRRGLKTVHEKWDLGIGVLSGDLILSVALKNMIDSYAKYPEVIKIFTNGLIAVCEGQALDKEYENNENITLRKHFSRLNIALSQIIIGHAKPTGSYLLDRTIF